MYYHCITYTYRITKIIIQTESELTAIVKSIKPNDWFYISALAIICLETHPINFIRRDGDKSFAFHGIRFLVLSTEVRSLSLFRLRVRDAYGKRHTVFSSSRWPSEIILIFAQERETLRLPKARISSVQRIKDLLSSAKSQMCQRNLTHVIIYRSFPVNYSFGISIQLNVSAHRQRALDFLCEMAMH